MGREDGRARCWVGKEENTSHFKGYLIINLLNLIFALQTKSFVVR